MSSRYPILDNRPIDQWKVTELKEELKRRKLTIKGLKEDLIKRLDEALRVEREEAAEAAEIEASEAAEKEAASEAAEGEASEAAEKEEAAKAAEKEEPTKSAEKEEAAETAEKEEAAVKEEAAKKEEVNGFEPDPKPVVGLKDSQTVTVVAEVVETTGRGGAEIVETVAKGNTGVVEPILRENAENSPEVVDDDSNKNDKLDGTTVPVDVTNSVPPTNQEEVGHDDPPACVDSVGVGQNLAVHGSTVETSIAVTESVLTEVVASGQNSYNTETQKENGGSATKLENEESRAQLESEDSKPQLDGGTEPPCEDVMPHTSASGNQVSEVYPSLGSQVKYDSLSSDSVSINEKNELKDNIIADNVKLEQDFVRPEMVEPSSSNIAPVYDESHSVDFGEQHEKKASLEENSNNVTSPDLNKATSIEDVVYPEKLNLDRSSGDDSMEEDLLESKQFDSKFNAADPRERREGSEVPVGREKSHTKVVGEGLSTGKTDCHDDDDVHPVVPAEKRKFHDQAFLGNNEPAKRQRRWNSEAVKVVDPQSTSLIPATTSKDEPVALRHNLSRSDSSATDEAPKERIVPPPQSSATNSLRIDRFLRPFTLKAVQELLGKTGNVVSFWMDHIKTHCYVTYSSVEEAIETRNAVYNLQWPPNGGRLLVAEFVDPQEVKMKLEAPPLQAATVSSGPAVPPTLPTSKPEPSPRQHREQPPVPATLPPPPPMSKAPPATRERLPSPPPHPEKVDPPIVTLDDLFRKTRSTPRIYYLPLSEEQVAAKLAAEGKSTKT